MTAVLHFLVIFEAAGLVGIPLAARAFGRLPGAGIAFARVLTWLVLAWVGWMLASLGVPNGTPLALASVVIVVAVAGYMHRRGGGVWPGSEPGFGRRLFIATEVLFVVTFAIAVFVGGYNADVNAPTEKPMDMMFINATLASADMPPADPWLSGTDVNYYYLGHYMVGLAIRLAAIEPSAGYNMGLAVVFALMVTTAFGAAATLAEAGRRQGLAIRRPLAAGAWCVVLLAFMATWNGGWKALHPGGPWREFDWFGPSRVVPTWINEWPFFSWTVGDLHAHFIAVPLTLLALAFVIQVGIGGPPALRSRTGLWETFAAALAIGWLYGVNSWSWPVMAALLVLTMLIWVTSPEATARRRTALLWTGAVLLAGIVLILPFILNFDPNARKAFAFTRTEQRETLGLFLKHHLAIEGPLLWLLVAPLVGALLALRHRLRVVVWGAAAIGFVLPLLARERLAGAAVALVLVAVTLAAGAARHRTTAERVLWAIAAMGLACILGTELGLVPDEFYGTEFERMNTIFKIGYQAWLLLAVFGAVALAAARQWLPRRVPRALWLAIAAVVIAISCAYVPVGTYARMRAFEDGPRVEGREWLLRSAPGDVLAIEYIREEVPGDAVILEAVGDDYSGFGNTRISTFTGRPTVLGWQGHEAQWSHGDEIGTRRQDVQTMYASRNVAEVRNLLSRYDVAYAVVGPLEKTFYGNIGALVRLGQPVFDRHGTTVYRLL